MGRDAPTTIRAGMTGAAGAVGDEALGLQAAAQTRAQARSARCIRRCYARTGAPTTLLLPLEQDVHGAGAAVMGAGAGESQHVPSKSVGGHPALERFLQHRDLVFRMQAAAVNDQHAALPLLAAAGKERHQLELG